MDAHYHKVIKMRDDITATGSRYYFAYSGVLDREAFELWREQHSYQFFSLPEGKIAEAKGLELVFDFPSRWWGGRVAGLRENSQKSIFGLLFEIPQKEWPIVQHKEGVISGMSIEKTIKVVADGKTYEATTFVTAPERASELGAISQRYIDAITRGAQLSKLPQNYIDYISSFKN